MEGRKWRGGSCIDYIIQHNPIMHNFPYFLRYLFGHKRKPASEQRQQEPLKPSKEVANTKDFPNLLSQKVHATPIYHTAVNKHYTLSPPPLPPHHAKTKTTTIRTPTPPPPPHPPPPSPHSPPSSSSPQHQQPSKHPPPSPTNPPQPSTPAASHPPSPRQPRCPAPDASRRAPCDHPRTRDPRR